MDTARYRYRHYDVFTRHRFSGNPLGVLPDARGLTSEQMQNIAREIGFSETAFVVPSSWPQACARLRIFTPATELPMAGHPIIGTTFAMVDEGLIAPGTASVTWELGTGPTPVDLEWQDDRLLRAWMTQPLPRFLEPLTDLDLVAHAIGVEPDDIDTRAPVQPVTAGVPFVFIPLRTRAAVDRAAPNVEAMAAIARQRGVEHAFVFTVERGNPAATVYSRMFAPALGIMEDPGTGGASGPLGAYLLRYRLRDTRDIRDPRDIHAPLPMPVLNLQGVAMGRPSRIIVDVEQHEEAIQRVRIGGEAVLVVEGALHL